MTKRGVNSKTTLVKESKKSKVCNKPYIGSGNPYLSDELGTNSVRLSTYYSVMTKPLN